MKSQEALLTHLDMLLESRFAGRERLDQALQYIKDYVRDPEERTLLFHRIRQSGKFERNQVENLRQSWGMPPE